MSIDQRTQSRHGGAEMRFRRIVEALDERVPLERRLDDAALHAGAAAVNEPHLAQAGLVRGGDVLLDDGLDVPRVEGVKVERAFDGDREAALRITR